MAPQEKIDETQNNANLQWNCRGIRANYEELQQLLTNHNPKIACLQETFLKESSSIKFEQYHPYNQATIVKTTLHKPIHICSIYIHPHDPISDIKMNKLLQPIPKPYLLLGDLNSHSTVWGYQKTNKNLCIFNDKSHTYLNPFPVSYSAINLALCNPISYMTYGWKVHDDHCGSDHFPILLEILQPLHDERLPHWKLNKANWEVFETLCKQKLFQDPNTSDQIKYFTETLISIANKSISKTSTPNNHNTPWFNDNCWKAIYLRKVALCKFNKQPTTTNLNNFKLLRAKSH